MNVSSLGYDKDLFILPFDHRSSFEAGLLGIRGRQADNQEVEQLAGYKQVIYDGFLPSGLAQLDFQSLARALVHNEYCPEIEISFVKKSVKKYCTQSPDGGVSVVFTSALK